LELPAYHRQAAVLPWRLIKMINWRKR